MTVDIATLGIRIDSSEARTAARDMENFRGAGARAEQQVTAIDAAARKAAQALQFLGIGAGVGAIIKMADEYTKFTAQLQLATQSQREYAAALEDVRRIAATAQQDLAATGTLYARIANGTRELGISQKNVADITETVNLALKVSGATSAEAASAMLQLSQSFASGTLRGEEFNAVNEAAPRLMKALADGIGVPVGALKDMASNGEITSKVMAQVLPQALQQLQEEAKHVQTISGAFTVLKNNVLEFTGTQAQANGTVAALTGGIMLLAENLNVLMGVVGTVTAVKLANTFTEWAAGAYQNLAANRALAASNLATAQTNVAATAAALATAQAREAELRASVLAAEGVVALAIAENGLIPAQARSIAAAQAHTAALAAQTTAASAASVGMGVLRGALALLGGPIGVVVTALGVAATAWSWYSSRSTEANAKTAEDTKASTAEVVAQMTKQIEVMERRNKLALTGVPTTGKQNPLDDKLAEIVSQMDQVAKAEGDYAKLSYEARSEVLKVLGGQYAEVTALIERFNKASADGAGNTTAAKALVEIRERVTGVSGQYQKDLKTYQTALAEGVIGMAEYTAGLTALAQETWKGSEAGKAAINSANKSAEAYKTLISSIREATATNKLELAAGIDASDSQKARIKLDQELASGKVKLTAGQLASVRAALAEQDASEKALKSQRSVAAAVADLNEQRRQDFAAAAAEAASNEQAAATFGMTKAQIEALTVARLQDRLVHAADLELTADDIAQTERLIAVKKKSADALTKTDALGYIKQLTEDNRKFAADSIIDERARAAALTEIDADVWRKRIALAGEGTEQQKQLQQQFDIWYRDQSIKPMLDEQREAVKKYDDVFRDGFADMLNHGKSGWRSFTTSLVTTFKTTVADQIYKMFAQPFVVKLVTSLLGVTGTGAATAVQAAGSATGAAGSALSVASLYNAAKSAYTAVTGGFTSLASGVTETVQSGLNMLGTNTGFYSSAGSGLPASALAQGAGVVATYLAGAGVGKLIGSAISGEYQIGNHGSAITNVSTIAGLFLGGPIGGAIGGAVGGLLNRAFGMGSKNVTSTSLQGTLASTGSNINTVEGWTQKGGWFRSDKSGVDRTPLDATQSAAFSNTYKAILDVSKTLGDTIVADTTALSARVQKLNIDLTGLKDATAQQEAITKFFAGVADTIGTELVPNLAQFQNEGEALSATLQRVATDYASVDVILGTIGKTFGAVGVSSIAARENLIAAAGGLGVLASGANFFQQNYLTQAEQIAPVQKQVTEQLAALGLSSVKTSDQFKAAVLGIDVSTEAGAKLFAQMMALGPAFKQVADYTESLKTKADELKAAAIVKATSNLKSAYDAETSARANTIASLTSAIESYKKFSDGLVLGSLSTLTPLQKLAQAQQQYENTLAAAKAGDTAAQANLATAANTYLTADQVVKASSDAYAADFAKVQADMAAVAAAAVGQLSDAQKQQASLDALVKGWISIDDSIKAGTTSVVDAIAALELAGGARVDGSHAAGLVSTPYNGYIAELHAGEPVIDAPAAAALRRYFGGTGPSGGANTSALVAEIKALRAEVAGLRADQEKQTGAIVSSTYEAAEINADKTNEGAKAAAKEGAYVANNPTWKEPA